jgi:signal transduction histidine kinase
MHHQQVFKLFRRLDPQGAVKGTGVGLTSVQSLMRRIKGEVSLQSDVNRGVQLTISFPSQTAK